MKRLRIAQVGAGEWSRYAHGPTLQRLAEQDRVSLEVICDLDIERARFEQVLEKVPDVEPAAEDRLGP